uniref:Phospholipase/carboxylesterase/thioesterase domain-containing protein n=1 Tax=Calcidiscus leptoporus TaxID=127549 RepID=A0A7S0JEA1_9EUKA|mmetsp:Transcript_51784/g.119008  ORF Transcript_51784/g.119008 Transcript_51784/m.119008 type:complete len:296 (+) Transcript_51784:60-947(+)
MRGVGLALLALLPDMCCGTLTPSDFEQRRGKLTPTSSAEVGLEEGLLFQLFVPLAWSTRWSVNSQAYPLIVFLHGRGESGGYDVTNAQSLPSLLLTNASFSSACPFLVLAPQCPSECAFENGWPQKVLQQITGLVHRWLVPTLGADRSRVFLAGQSMGGNGAWMYAAQQPRFFAAVVVICGYVAPGLERSVADRLARTQLPVLVCHSADDSVIDVQASDMMVEALRKTQHPFVRYVRYEHAPGPPMPEYAHLIGHGSYELLFRDTGLYKWLLQQRCMRCEHPPRAFHALLSSQNS